VLEAARALAGAFEAELACVHAPADMADLMPWMGEGFMGGVQVTALESLKEAAVEGHHAVDKLVAELGYARSKTVSLDSPVWAGLAMEGRLSDVIVFDSAAARGKGRWPRPSSRWSPTSSGPWWWRAGAEGRAGPSWSPGTAARRPAGPCARLCRCCRRPPRWWWPGRRAPRRGRISSWSAWSSSWPRAASRPR
jgi:hypothetical protein